MEEWIWSVAIKKVLKRLTILMVTYLLSHNFDKIGIQVDQAKFQDFIFVSIYGLLEGARNYFKIRFGWRFF